MVTCKIRTPAGIACIAVALTVVSARADGLIYQLPKDGAWARYEVEMTSVGKAPGEGVEESHVQGTLQLSSVGGETVDGEPCRWIEIAFEISPKGSPASASRVLKLLIPETRLKRGEDPFQHVREMHYSQGGILPEVSGERIEESETISGADYSRRQYELDRIRSMFPPVFENVQIGREKVETQLGTLECERLSGTAELANSPLRGGGEWAWSGEFECLLNDQVPFGVVSLRGELEGFEKTRETTQFETEIILKIVDFGEGQIRAQAETEDSQADAEEEAIDTRRTGGINTKAAGESMPGGSPYTPRDDWPELQSASTESKTARVVVGPNIHVSASLERSPYWECVLAAHPENPDRLFAAVMYGHGTVSQAGFYSPDGGATWKLGCDLAAVPGDRYYDPSVAFGRDDNVYLVHMFMSSKGDSLHFYASADAGEAWEQRSVLPGFVDRPWLTVATTPGADRGKLYCIGQTNPDPVIYASKDGARTLVPLRIPPTDRELNDTDPANPVVLPDGTVLFAYSDRYVGSLQSGASKPHPQFHVLRTADGGDTLTRATPVNTKWWHESIYSQPDTLGAQFPQLAADPGSGKLAGRVYCVWADGNDKEYTRIFFCASPDGGETWAQPVVISEQPMDAELDTVWATYIPSIAVNRDGVVAVSWYDRRGLPQPRRVQSEIEVDGRTVVGTKLVTEGWNVRMRVSLDGGETWLPSVQINEEVSRGPGNVGHTAGLVAAADGRFHAAWIDDRTGTKQLWSASIDVRLDE